MITLEEHIAQLRELAEELVFGPFGVTWYVDDHAIAHTGFVYELQEEAREAAREGPWATEKKTQVDGLCDHYPEDEGVQIWAEVETDEYRVMDQFWCEGGPVD